MTARILDGRAVAAQLQAELAGEVERLAAAGLRPGLAAVLVGDDEASHIYVGAKQRAAGRWGIESRRVALPADASERQVLDEVAALNADPAIHGIIVQLPLPPGLEPVRVQEAIDPAKDVDGLHPWNEGRVLRGDPGLVPCTAAGIVELLRREKVQVEGSHVVIVGRGLLVGRPLSVLLSAKAPGANATVTLCHTGTRDVGHFTRQADVLVAAVGVPGMITPDMVKPGAAVVDAGNHRVEGRLVGDVVAEVAEVAGAYTPVPGGVGPMTVAMLLANTVTAAAGLAPRAAGRGGGA
ncbi:MAG TPA: bifunctional 5,10-methylenetetrahydrofolate dehydrogenase/5,10-methenyltetrahydrofolate cyclohydrolase [Actinomycetes bacterium]|jgi:methylenetetrahydrofolate dehydrogenase (NADP+)/methenyltetrahydrofolate cyclohydrolase|nr:bifunctional 5,10-methylenetetrahydrofolate dehydrogenase/5,10-methenyltetrahydrofolate cyclohydrolase [Actinomycetes bacterium]